MNYKKTIARVRRWWRVMKGPPPRKHGVIPIDYEPHDLPACKRLYLHDPGLSLRPAQAYYRYVAGFCRWEDDREAKRANILDASRDPDRAGYRPQQLEVNRD